MLFLVNWTVTNTINYKETRSFFSFSHMQKLSIINSMRYQNKLNPALLHPTPGERCSELRWRLQCFSGGDILFYIHMADAFFMFKAREAFSPSILKVFTQQQS